MAEQYEFLLTQLFQPDHWLSRQRMMLRQNREQLLGHHDISGDMTIIFRERGNECQIYLA
ncbi:hypothetical protein D3C73_1382040 [compost metagenome]